MVYYVSTFLISQFSFVEINITCAHTFTHCCWNTHFLNSHFHIFLPNVSGIITLPLVSNYRYRILISNNFPILFVHFHPWWKRTDQIFLIPQELRSRGVKLNLFNGVSAPDRRSTNVNDVILLANRRNILRLFWKNITFQLYWRSEEQMSNSFNGHDRYNRVWVR